MMRNLIVLGCAGLLALGLSIGSLAGVTGGGSTDGDGIPDSNDNCITTQNGPFGGACSAQQDGLNAQNPNEPDGYGVACDTDFNNNGATDAADLGVMLIAATGVASMDVHTDLNCNGAADGSDLGVTLIDALGIAAIPGPSGKACAGTVPCVIV